MAAPVDQSPFGSRAPGVLDRAVLALTGAVPDNWLGLRLAIGLRRLTTMRSRAPLDVERWGYRFRLYPLGNGCEKNLLFTPQMYDVLERRVIGEAIDRKLALGGAFTFVDLGANVGLYSLFVASRAGERGRILAFEPQPGIVDRLRYNVSLNPAAKIKVMPIAIADREGTVELLVNPNDSGGTSIAPGAAANVASVPVTVPCRPLLSVLDAEGITSIDAMKIDIEGAEDVALVPFLRDAPRNLLPGLIVIEDTRGLWRTNVFALLEQHGYTVKARSRHNVALQRKDPG